MRNLVLKVFWIPLCISLKNIMKSKQSESDEDVMDKLIGISTDGESANTGSKGGFVGATDGEIAKKADNYVVCLSSV